MTARSHRDALLLTGLLSVIACSEPAPLPAPTQPDPAEFEPALPPEAPAPERPVPFWEDGTTPRVVDAETAAADGYLLLDLGEAWTPYVFTDGATADGKPLVNAYRKTYLQLSRGPLAADRPRGRMPSTDDLEAQGFLPTLALLRERMQRLDARAQVQLAKRPSARAKGARLEAESHAELQRLVRVLTERAMSAAGLLEDGSAMQAPDGTPRTFQSEDGRELGLRNLRAELEHQIVSAFGLTTPRAALDWLRSLGELRAGEHRLVALRTLELPEYYEAAMDLRIAIDRGDVWYDFPYGPHGEPLAQPVKQRPAITVIVRYLGQDIPLVRYATTIGGWRTKQIGDQLMWRYQGSPVGKRVWSEIVAAPIWIPPETTQPKTLLRPARANAGSPDHPQYEVNYELTGPGHTSALGLVAAYHSRLEQERPGGVSAEYDEGIRTHGSAHAAGLSLRQSNGCHRLPNATAVRLMSFVLAHRPHQRRGQVATVFRRSFQFEDQGYDLELSQGGYVFALNPPLPVDVLQGRIRGRLKRPMSVDVPQYDAVHEAYVRADGTAVQVQAGRLIDVGRADLDDSPAPEPAPSVSPITYPEAAARSFTSGVPASNFRVRLP